MTLRAIILGAGRPYSGDVHAGLRRANTRTSVLEWQASALKAAGASIDFVGGYQMDSIRQKHPSFHFIFNADWEKTGALKSLFCAPFTADDALIVSYSDIVYRPDIVRDLISTYPDDVTIAIDSHYRERYAISGGRFLPSTEMALIDGDRVVSTARGSTADNATEFCGMIYVPVRHAGIMMDLQRDFSTRDSRDHLSALVNLFTRSGIGVRYIDIHDQWTDLNNPLSLTRFIMRSKADTLDNLGALLEHGKTCDQISFTVGQYRAGEDSVIKRILSRFPGLQLAVRSSSLSEDSFTTANAGVFDSVLNVAAEPESISDAINQVMSSFPSDHDRHQVFVQPMVENVVASGVIVTRMINSGSPYYCVNFTEGHQTDLVTSGQSDCDKVIMRARGSESEVKGAPGWIDELFQSMAELEFLLDHDALDVEFAVNGYGEIYILQVRPVVIADAISDQRDVEIERLRRQGMNHFISLQPARPGCVGGRTVFGIMPDWNPAEIIGTKPTVLAATLYAELIMNDVWARQRAEYGYRDVRPQPLMRLFAGQPYIDVRASLNSFTPATISGDVAGRLVDFYLDWLEQHPSLHDKIEFDVVPTCYGFDFARWEQRFIDHDVIGPGDIATLKSALLKITNGGFARIENDSADLDDFIKSYGILDDSSCAGTLESAFSFIDYCAAHGTVIFSHLARSAFVAMTLLRSAVSTGVIGEGRLQDYLLSIRTVSSVFAADAWRVQTGAMTMDQFIDTYGHLRPGTYDITSLPYEADPEFYLESAIRNATKPRDHDFSWTEEERNCLGKVLQDHGLNLSVDAFDSFCRKAIEGREFSKFVFTRHLSRGMEDICAYAQAFGLSRHDVSHIPLSTWRSVMLGTVSDCDIERYLYEELDKNAHKHTLARLIELPPLIFSAEDFNGFVLPMSMPNFITGGRVISDVKGVDHDPSTPGDLAGKIVYIDAADPGYDWLFGQGIGGLITKYGGANSHMAIRAAEFGLPAAIGVGEVFYRNISAARKIDLNCGNRKIVIVE